MRLSRSILAAVIAAALALTACSGPARPVELPKPSAEPRPLTLEQARERGLDMLRKGDLGSSVTTVGPLRSPHYDRDTWEVVSDTGARLEIDRETGSLDHVFLFGEAIRQPARKLGPRAALAEATRTLKAMGAQVPSEEPSMTVDANGNIRFVWERVERGLPVEGDWVAVHLTKGSRALYGYHRNMYAEPTGPALPKLSRAEAIGAALRDAPGSEVRDAWLRWVRPVPLGFPSPAKAHLAWVVVLRRDTPLGNPDTVYYISAIHGGQLREPSS